MDGHDGRPVEVGEDVRVGEEDSRVELEQELAQDNTGYGAKTKDDKIKNISWWQHGWCEFLAGKSRSEADVPMFVRARPTSREIDKSLDNSLKVV